MKIVVTGATGLIGTALVEHLKQRGDEITVFSRDPARAEEQLGVRSVAWDPQSSPAPADTLSGQDGTVHLAGEPVAQRWNSRAKQAICRSRELGTRNLVAGIQASSPRPQALVCSSAVGYYGPRGSEPLDEQAKPGDDFLATVCKSWEAEAGRASEFGVRVASIRTGLTVSSQSSAIKKMLPPFKAGVGGPIGRGRYYISWIHLDDLVGIITAALDDDRWSGPINATAPEPVTNKEFSKTLGRVLHRPAVIPVPPLALKLLYGEMSGIITTGQRAVPTRALELGYQFEHPQLEGALRASLA